MNIEEEIARALDSAFPMSRESAIDTLVPVVKRAQAEALRNLADLYWEHEGQNPVTEACLLAADRYAPRAERNHSEVPDV